MYILNIAMKKKSTAFFLFIVNDMHNIWLQQAITKLLAKHFCQPLPVLGIGTDEWSRLCGRCAARELPPFRPFEK